MTQHVLLCIRIFGCGQNILNNVLSVVFHFFILGVTHLYFSFLCYTSLSSYRPTVWIVQYFQLYSQPKFKISVSFSKNFYALEVNLQSIAFPSPVKIFDN